MDNTLTKEVRDASSSLACTAINDTNMKTFKDLKKRDVMYVLSLKYLEVKILDVINDGKYIIFTDDSYNIHKLRISDFADAQIIECSNEEYIYSDKDTMLQHIKDTIERMRNTINKLKIIEKTYAEDINKS